MYEPEGSDWDTIKTYRDLCDRAKIWRNMKWRGHDVAKTPEDMWLYQETIADLRPSLIVEFGTSMGGTALFFADMLELLGINDGRVLSIDNQQREPMPVHPRLTLLHGHSRHDKIIEYVTASAIMRSGPVLLIEDSEHTYQHVRAELEIYAPLVTFGSYFVVEDLSYPEEQSPVRKAVEEFLAENRHFEVDKTKDRYLVSVAPGGWLKRVR